MLPAPLIGVIADHFRVPARQAIILAAQMGFEMIELAATNDLDPRVLSETGRRDLRRHVGSRGLTFAALGHAIEPSAWTARRMEQTIEQTRRILEMAGQLAVPVVTSEAPPLPTKPEQWEGDLLIQAIAELAGHADKVGVTLALGSPGTPPPALAALLRQMDCPHLQAMLDPAWLLMIGQDPTAAVAHVAGKLAITHLRDAVPGRPDAPGFEVALGRGQLDVPGFLEMLAQTGPPRPVMLARSGGKNPVEDLAAARKLVAGLQRTAQ